MRHARHREVPSGRSRGGTIPLGFEGRTVEVRSKKVKKRLFKSESEPPTVRLIFDLAERDVD
jgi:hypothetical protein